MNFCGKNCRCIAADRRRSSGCRGVSAVHRLLQQFSGFFLLLLLGLVPVAGFAKITVRLPFVEEKRIWGKDEGRSGYLKHQSGRQVPLVAEAEAQEENPGPKADTDFDPVSFRAFLEQMEAQAAEEKEAAAGEKSGEAEAAGRSGPGSAQAESGEAESGDGSTSEGNGAEGGGTAGTGRTTVSSTESGADTDAGYAFPRPERERTRFEDIFLYFPVESGDLQKIGLMQEAGSGSRFMPPRPSGLKSRAIFEQIER